MSEYEKFQKEFIYSSQDFIEITNMFEDDANNKETIYKLKKNHTIGVLGGYNSEGFEPILSYTVRSGDDGKLDYIFLHELCHVIETEEVSENARKCGFDFLGDYENNLNPYNSQERKYERLNETITDIFAIEARKILHEQNIYFMEPQKLIDANVNDYNTQSIVKGLLTPFIDKYRQPIIRARLSQQGMKELYDIISGENFEELNDVVNKVDSLEGLAPKLENNQNEEPVVVEYYKQLERLKQIYDNMEKYHTRNATADNLVRSAVSATEGKTRLEQINNGIISMRDALEKEPEKDEGDLNNTRD